MAPCTTTTSLPTLRALACRTAWCCSPVRQRPERELLDGLAQVGVRGLWLGAAAQALGAASFARFDAVVLKVRGPMAEAARSFEGWRRTLGCPLLVVAEAGDEFDEIIALELGADGYLAGPVPPRRLRAHLLMLLRRAQPGADAAAPAAPLRAGAWTLDRSANRLQRGRHEVDLTELQAALLQVLIAEQGRVVLAVPRLAEAVSRGRELHVRSVDVYIARLRCRLRDERVAGLEIDGVCGRGYRLTVLGDMTPLPTPCRRGRPCAGWRRPGPLARWSEGPAVHSPPPTMAACPIPP